MKSTDNTLANLLNNTRAPDPAAPGAFAGTCPRSGGRRHGARSRRSSTRAHVVRRLCRRGRRRGASGGGPARRRPRSSRLEHRTDGARRRARPRCPWRPPAAAAAASWPPSFRPALECAGGRAGPAAASGRSARAAGAGREATAAQARGAASGRGSQRGATGAKAPRRRSWAGDASWCRGRGASGRVRTGGRRPSAPERAPPAAVMGATARFFFRHRACKAVTALVQSGFVAGVAQR